jgi:molybdenum cofactor biosynthesis protein B
MTDRDGADEEDRQDPEDQHGDGDGAGGTDPDAGRPTGPETDATGFAEQEGPYHEDGANDTDAGAPADREEVDRPDRETDQAERPRHHAEEHEHHVHDLDTLRLAVVTVSSTRSLDDDPSGEIIVTAAEAAGHEVVDRELIADEYDNVQQIVGRLVERADTDCVVTTGGTGVTPDDVTVEAVEPLFDKRLPGVGQLFRWLSYEEIGTRVVATRAVGGVASGVPVFCLPGSENAARLGIEDVVLPEAPHIAGLARRGLEEDEEE